MVPLTYGSMLDAMRARAMAESGRKTRMPVSDPWWDVPMSSDPASAFDPGRKTRMPVDMNAHRRSEAGGPGGIRMGNRGFNFGPGPSASLFGDYMNRLLPNRSPFGGFNQISGGPLALASLAPQGTSVDPGTGMPSAPSMGDSGPGPEGSAGSPGDDGLGLDLGIGPNDGYHETPTTNIGPALGILGALALGPMAGLALGKGLGDVSIGGGYPGMGGDPGVGIDVGNLGTGLAGMNLGPSVADIGLSTIGPDGSISFGGGGMSNADAAAAAQADAADASLGGFEGGYDSGNGGGGGKIICAELYRQGLMDYETYAADECFGALLALRDPQALAGYQRWAKYVVRCMRKSKLVTRVVSRIASPWIQEMAHQMGKGDGSETGRRMMKYGHPLCRLFAPKDDEFKWLAS